MPFVIKFPDGFLNRDGAHKRRLTPELDEATVWSKKGHAKNAARAAVENGVKLKKGVVVKIIPVSLRIACATVTYPDGRIDWPSAESYNPRK